MNSRNTLLWLRRDLRLSNNPALEWALANSDRLLLVYIHAPDEEASWQAGGASRWWLHHSLANLQQAMEQQQLTLHYYRGDSQSVLQQLIEEHRITQVCWNNLYEPALFQRDQALMAGLGDVSIRQFHDGYLLRPGSLLNQQQLPYRVYTPFSRKLKSLLNAMDWTDTDIDSALPKNKPAMLRPHNALSLEELHLLDRHPWHERLRQYWQPGEARAWDMLESFLENPVQDYHQQRDYPAIAGTSGLSAALHFGEITPQQILTCLRPLLYSANNASVNIFLNQIIWREFAGHILWHYPHTADTPMDERYTNDFWETDEAVMRQWQRGETGIPIIDAGMKQLWQTGWMHNRVRMIVSSFLTKNLGQHWLAGARWFWDTLVDADLANNTLGWQWVAGCGVDAAPYFRVFNPVTQASRFDPDLAYVRRWAPEALELDYPPPMVDLSHSRKQALARYRHFIIEGAARK